MKLVYCLVSLLEQNTDRDDLSDVMEEVVSIRSLYFQLGRTLRLQDHDLKLIREVYTNEADALNDVLLLWLDQKYNVKRFGQPTWRTLVRAVDKETGGNNRGLALKLASNHPAGRMKFHVDILDAIIYIC